MENSKGILIFVALIVVIGGVFFLSKDDPHALAKEHVALKKAELPHKFGAGIMTNISYDEATYTMTIVYELKDKYLEDSVNWKGPFIRSYKKRSRLLRLLNAGVIFKNVFKNLDGEEQHYFFVNKNDL